MTDLEKLEAGLEYSFWDQEVNARKQHAMAETARLNAIGAAGNVLHVHDLVDFVSEEAGAAGRAAAGYLAAGGVDKERHPIPVTFEGGVRYTVPGTIDPAFVGDSLVVRYRVGGVMKNRLVTVWMDGEQVSKKRRQIMAPGEMEEVKLTRDMFDRHPDLKTLLIRIEEV